ncbi:BREX-1 system adenine-specific DNA-methyltransferase PglX [Aeromonas caviae]|uniref:BREX-1 system adenine-specific DNA-methyltransferase PglX n=1 Tax=Aeromonas caviae TaxID=648 RepID=UPI0015DCDA8D|nr:BREX-1 system adenine-specific DNA-methyltransferase PglX [Aeromonas caviae]BBR09397.1 class I SAM-dependent DNA methyltransferase [Aeromonas caviae]
MNTANLKKIAPRARTAFIAAIKARAAEFGITAKGHAEYQLSGEVLQVAGFTHPASIAPALKRLQQRLEHEGFENLMEQMAYTWFNRFCAIRFMELKSDEGYLEHGVRLLSHPSQPQGFEVLDRVPEVIDSLIGEGVALDKPALFDLLLAGNEQEALFRELLLGQCHCLHQAMPFLFEAIDDETELLLPTGLTRTDAFWRDLVDAIPEADWQQVEVIGWLYQFYILDEKERVDQKVKAGNVVNSSEIPAKTQLFTPNWIVQYLVQNSIGRHWLQTYPDSGLQQAMPYYVAPGEQPTEVMSALAAITPASIEPESIKVLDPACGSGHILVEAYNLLYRIYEERGYRSREIPELILKHNLFGLDIDDRAAQLAGFALLMRARQDDRRLFTRDLSLHIHALQESRHLNMPKLWQALNLNADWDRGQVQDMFAVAPATLAANDPRLSLLNDLHRRFLDAKTLGSLIEVPSEQVQAIDELVTKLQTLSISGDAMQKLAAKALLPLLAQAGVLARRYNAVIANPPYMGSKGMNANLKAFAKNNFPASKSDLFAMFIEQGLKLVSEHAYCAMVTMEAWMFLTSYTNLRIEVLNKSVFQGLIHLPYEGRSPTAMGINFGVCAFITQKINITGFEGGYSRLRFLDLNEFGSPKDLVKIKMPDFRKAQNSFNLIPGCTIAFDATERSVKLFGMPKLSVIYQSGGRCKTSNDEKFLRRQWEVSAKKIGINNEWCLLSKGGDFRRYFGNVDTVMRWDDEAKNEYASKGGLTRPEYWEKPGITWTIVSSKGAYAFRIKDGETQYNSVSPTIFGGDLEFAVAYLNSVVSNNQLKIIAPTLAANVGEVLNLPYIPEILAEVKRRAKNLISIARADWDSYEISHDFKTLRLINTDGKNLSITHTYQQLRTCWREMMFEMLHLEQDNNSLFLEAYGLQDELTPEVPLSEITLTCNPHYRYGGNLTDEEREARLQSDTIAELISYAIGCMMGRYSLDREGLIYAHAGNEGFKTLVEEGAYATFAADEDGILPLTADNWFPDDVAARIEQFVRTVWGAETLEENLQFIADSLCLAAIKPVKKGGETARETIRRYLSTQFFKDHMKTYKKRPIYWLFSSGKEKAFECLVYLHRYNEATLPRMRTEYVTPLLGQMAGRIERLRLQQAEAGTAEAKRIGKEIETLTKQLAELRAFDDELKHHADMRIRLDLDDGVKVNYGKFGTLLSEVKAITGDKGE